MYLGWCYGIPDPSFARRANLGAATTRIRGSSQQVSALTYNFLSLCHSNPSNKNSWLLRSNQEKYHQYNGYAYEYSYFNNGFLVIPYIVRYA